MPRLRKPIVVTNTYLVLPQVWDVEEDEAALSSFDRHLQTLLGEVDGLRLSLSDFLEFPAAGSAEMCVDRLSRNDMRVLEANTPFAPLMGDAIPIRVTSRWIEPGDIAEMNRARGIYTQRAVVTRTCANYIDSMMGRLLVLMTCYLPGSSHAGYSYNSVDHEYAGSLGCLNSFHNVPGLLLRNRIEPTPTKSFKEFLAWSRKVPGYWRGLPETNVGRALNFIRHAHHRTLQMNNLADISWIVAALERLFTDSNAEVSRKLSRRALALTPALTSLVGAKGIAKVYDFRSRFLHGGPKNSKPLFVAGV